MKTLPILLFALLLAIAGSFPALAADPPAATPPAAAKTDAKKPEPPKVTDAQRATAWKASARVQSATAKKNKALAEYQAAASEEATAQAELEKTLGSLCSSEFQLSNDANGEPTCIDKPAAAPSSPPTAAAPKK